MSSENLEAVLDKMQAAATQLEQAASKLQAAPPPAPPPPPEPDPYEGKDPTQLTGPELEAYIEYKAKKRAAEVLEQKLQPVQQKLSTIEELERKRMEQQLAAEIQDMAAKHKDFNELLPRITKLATEHPTLRLQQLYTLAKTEVAKPQEVDNNQVPKESAKLATERPTHSAAKPTATVTIEKDLPRGGRGISVLVRKAFEQGAIKLP